MAVKFISYVDQNEDGNWYIKLTDTLDDTSVICNDLDEYKKQIEELGGEYGGDIEVVWEKSPTLTPRNYQDLSDKMEKLQEEYKDEIDKINNTNNSSNQEGFDPNA